MSCYNFGDGTVLFNAIGGNAPLKYSLFGDTTIKAVEERGLRVDIAAPTPETPSMTMALEKYIEKVNKGK